MSPLLFSLLIKDVDCLAANVHEAVTGAGERQVSHMLCANNLCLTAKYPDQLQLTLDRLCGYAPCDKKRTPD